jgi:uncharacterized membrane protein YdjX (TVP38/TMEM64 family)
MTEVQAIRPENRSEAGGYPDADAPGTESRVAPESERPGNRGGEVKLLTPKRIVPLAVIVCGFIGFFAFDLDSYVTFDALKQNREWLLNQVSEHRVATVVAFITIYAAIAALSVPGATVASITGGFLFGLLSGTVWNVIAATTGATLLFLAARTVFGDILHKKAGPWLHKLESGFQENAFNYLLALRLVPAFPFFVVNLVPAFLNVRLRTFVVTTFIGIIPGAFVYTSVGAGLGSVFDSGEEFSASSVLTPQIIAAMLGLVALSLLPVAYRMWQARRG